MDYYLVVIITSVLVRIAIRAARQSARKNPALQIVPPPVPAPAAEAAEPACAFCSYGQVHVFTSRPREAFCNYGGAFRSVAPDLQFCSTFDPKAEDRQARRVGFVLFPPAEDDEMEDAYALAEDE